MSSDKSFHISNFFIIIYICYEDLWTVIFVLDFIFFGLPQTVPMYEDKLNWLICYVSWMFYSPPTSHFPLLGTLFHRLAILKGCRLITLQWFLSVHWKKELNICHFKSKAKRDWAQWGRHIRNQDKPKARASAPIRPTGESKGKFLRKIWSSLLVWAHK